ncbi:deoxyribodipyrimidine photo-lyase [Croceicoccus sp. F390]|uniref:Deoxyribodipyrimidine photo-lyase n=1 Tax=Croceicoccus esteveae TaxID=3075597 RepID=A0ABU2ZH12_9SPHN|nr:deoxyribodipyrimidine photo-lyase [Croceicoccus sp. F390]MDT0574889.1 deoxyribodipyrimidine photo-lyase [Croceicoccus sp. F390]
MPTPQIVWLRRDLRLADQPAFAAAAAAGPVIPVYVLDDAGAGSRQLGGASRWWLHHSLAALEVQLQKQGMRLILRRGKAAEELVRLADETGAGAIHAIRHYEPWWKNAEEELSGQLELCLQDGNYLLPPGSVRTGAGKLYRIYTPFARAAMQMLPQRDPIEAPPLTSPQNWPQSDRLTDWHLLPSKPDWAAGFAAEWTAGEDAAHAQLDAFVQHVASYDDQRNLPAIDGTSRLSPHLHWGEISPTQVWKALEGRDGTGVQTYRSELLWRDFAQNVICQFRDYDHESYRDRFKQFPWRQIEQDSAAAADLRAWQEGRTGYPIVDAGMRQLWQIGWMHNRVRMITASFLIKHLLIDWTIGERWFWDTLVDADFGNNSVNWQWVAGTGVDTSLFTRIMAPLSQSDKFDAGEYIRQWVPELADLPDEQIHDPDGKCRPSAYPDRRIPHREARERALAAYRTMREKAG